MFNLKLYTTLFLAGFLFPVLSFTQITPEYLSPGIENFPLYPSELQINNDNATNSHFKDEDDLLIARRIDDWEDDAWVATDSSEYYYNEDNLLIERLNKTFFDNEWYVSHRSIYEYDTNNNQTSNMYQNWDGVMWVNSSRIVQEYDANGNRTLWQDQYWSCLLYTSPSPRDLSTSRMPSSA